MRRAFLQVMLLLVLTRAVVAQDGTPVGAGVTAAAGNKRAAGKMPALPSDAPRLALTPPMGWNSWDSYGMTVTEAEYKANADWMARHLKPFGWQYAVVDEGWYIQNPESGGKPSWQFTLDREGRFLPAPNRFPSTANDAGFKPLADYVHSLGL